MSVIERKLYFSLAVHAAADAVQLAYHKGMITFYFLEHWFPESAPWFPRDLQLAPRVSMDTFL